MQALFKIDAIASVQSSPDGYVGICGGDYSKPFGDHKAAIKFAVERIIEAGENSAFAFEGYVVIALHFDNECYHFVFLSSDLFDYKKSVISEVNRFAKKVY
jgi:hypothetical protein